MGPLPQRRRQRSLHGKFLLTIAYGALCIFLGVAQVTDQTREEAVAAAREGRLEEGIAMLRKVLAERPDDSLAAFDLAVILTWSNRPKEATEAFELARAEEVPEFVLAPILRAYRDQKRFAEAERLARKGIEQFPLSQIWPALLGLVLTDQQKTTEAIELLEHWTETLPHDLDLWMALGYAYFTAGDRFGALRAYGHALRLQPENKEAADVMARILSAMGGPYGAEALLKKSSPDLEASQAALQLRWAGTIESPDPEKPFERIDAALEHLDRLLRKARSARPQNSALVLRLRQDRIVALLRRERWTEVVWETEKLRAEGHSIPPYLIQAEADSLLATRYPTEAREGFEEVLKLDPTSVDAHTGRFYALADEGRFYDAFDEIDTLAQSYKPEARLPEQRVTYPDWDWLYLTTLTAEARLYADMLDDAWDRLLPLAEGAPANVGLRLKLGGLAGARGWPRRSDEEIQIAASMQPRDRQVQIALTETAIRRQRWQEARERVQYLDRLFPGNPQVRRAKIDLDAHDSWAFYSHFQYHYEPPSSEAADGGLSPGTGYDLITRLTSAPIHEYWRIVWGFEYHQANVSEGLAERIREGVGVELRLPDFGAEGMIWMNNGSLSEPGGSLSIRWTPTDHWIFRAKGEIFAADTPLRAVLNGITANMAGGGIEYYWSESRTLSLDAQWYDFSDGNRRYAINLGFAQKVVDIPNFDLTLRPNLYTSHNDRNDGPYFSPLRDFSGSVGLDADHVIWRRFERSFGERLVLTAGGYWQEDFGTGWTGSIRYEQVYKHTPWAEVRYGLQGSRNIYDGTVVPSLDAFVQLNLLF